MNVVVSGGGTAGHINPALALADELARRGHTVYYAGTPAGVEARLVPQAGVPFTAFEAAGFNRSHPASIFHAVKLIAASTRKAKAWFNEIKPDVVVCFGGFVCIPVGRAAEQMGVPVVVHEQNSIMGMANKYLAKKAAAVALTYEVAGKGVVDPAKLVVTGNPVRRSVFDATRAEGRAYAGVPEDALMLVVFGGSLGARHINTALAECKDRLLSRPNLYVRHITGPKEFDAVRDQLALTDEEAKRWTVVGYEDRMGDVLAACDMVVSRAGATSLAEISALQIPALLVPYPYATANHQATNAREYVAAGAAFEIDDDKVETPEFSRLLGELVDDASVRERMKAAAASFETGNAAAKLADVVSRAATR